MSEDKVIERIYGKIVQTNDGIRAIEISDVREILEPLPSALGDAEANQYYRAVIKTNNGPKNAVIARYKNKNKASRKFHSFRGNTRIIGNETGMLMRNVWDDPDQMRYNIWTKDSMQSVLPSTPRGEDDRVDFKRMATGYGASGRSKK